MPSLFDWFGNAGGGLLGKLGQTWPARIAQSAYGAATLPGDVYAGRIDPMSDESIGRSADLAGLIMGGTFAGAPAGAVGAGPIGRRLGRADFDRILRETRAAEAEAVQKAGPEITTSMPAVIDSKGNVYSGFMHTDAINAAQNAGASPTSWYWPMGYVTNKGRFILRSSSDAGPNWLSDIIMGSKK